MRTDPQSYDEHDQFPGVIGRTVSTSIPAWPTQSMPRSGSPNVVVVLLDDVGFAQLGCFGAAIETATFDRLAANGLRYSSFHTTPMCTPSRASLLTGRNAHAAGAGYVEERGFPSYGMRISKANGFLSEILRTAGYATFALGKWHLAPDSECTAGSTRARWPLSRGFDRYYGFLGGHCDQYGPELVHDSHFIEPPRWAGRDYHLNDDLGDRAIEFVTDLRAVAPDQPFFLYWCPGAGHNPHHVPTRWSVPYRAAFDGGWEHARQEAFARQVAAGLVPEATRLESRPDWIPPWNDLRADERRLFARQMEVYAGFLTHTDHHIGRLVDFLERLGELDNTIFIVASDNGAEAAGPHGRLHLAQTRMDPDDALAESIAAIDEWGGPNTYPVYAWGWTWAGNTPLRRWKRFVHEGGVRVPFIIHWPAGIAARNEVRGHYVHIVDVAATILDALGIEPPETVDGVHQLPRDGVSFADTFADGEAMTAKHVQYYEMLGSRGIWRDGWKAVTEQEQNVLLTDELLDTQRWELYDVSSDVSEHDDLSGVHPDKLRELVDLWWAEAGRNAVLPLDARRFDTGSTPPDGRVQGQHLPRRFVYYPGGAPLSVSHAPAVWGVAHRISVAMSLTSDSDGMLLAAGDGRVGGFALYVQHRRLHYVYNHLGRGRSTVVSDTELPSGSVVLSFQFEPTDDDVGIGRLAVDGADVGQGEVLGATGDTGPLLSGSFTCGYADSKSRPLCPDYVPPFRFRGDIDHAVVELTS